MFYMQKKRGCKRSPKKQTAILIEKLVWLFFYIFPFFKSKFLKMGALNKNLVINKKIKVIFMQRAFYGLIYYYIYKDYNRRKSM